MRNRIWKLFVFATLFGCAAALIQMDRKMMRWAVGPEESCPACDNPVVGRHPRCTCCGARLMYRKEK